MPRGFATLLPDPLAGWKAEKAQTSAARRGGFGASTASRDLSNAKGDHVEVAITGDSAMIAQFAPLLANPQIAGAMGKIVRIGNQRAIQNADGDIHLVVANKFLVMVSGTAGARGQAELMPARSISASSRRCSAESGWPPDRSRVYPRSARRIGGGPCTQAVQNQSDGCQRPAPDRSPSRS